MTQHTPTAVQSTATSPASGGSTPSSSNNGGGRTSTTPTPPPISAARKDRVAAFQKLSASGFTQQFATDATSVVDDASYRSNVEFPVSDNSGSDTADAVEVWNVVKCKVSHAVPSRAYYLYCMLLNGVVVLLQVQTTVTTSMRRSHPSAGGGDNANGASPSGGQAAEHTAMLDVLRRDVETAQAHAKKTKRLVWMTSMHVSVDSM
jgi:hypothetical protein